MNVGDHPFVVWNIYSNDTAFFPSEEQEAILGWEVQGHSNRFFQGQSEHPVDIRDADIPSGVRHDGGISINSKYGVNESGVAPPNIPECQDSNDTESTITVMCFQ